MKLDYQQDLNHSNSFRAITRIRAPGMLNSLTAHVGPCRISHHYSHSSLSV